MMVIELRQAAKEKAFDLLEEIKTLGHEKKMALCELEETLYECFESSEEDDEEYENEDVDMEYRKRMPYRYGRRNMRDEMHDMDDEEMHNMRSNRRSMRMRRNRMGRFV
jgi:hypothetical protein